MVFKQEKPEWFWKERKKLVLNQKYFQFSIIEENILKKCLTDTLAKISQNICAYSFYLFLRKNFFDVLPNPSGQQIEKYSLYLNSEPKLRWTDWRTDQRDGRKAGPIFKRMFYNVKKGPLKIRGNLFSKFAKTFLKKSRSPMKKGRIEFDISFLKPRGNWIIWPNILST